MKSTFRSNNVYGLSSTKIDDAERAMDDVMDTLAISSHPESQDYIDGVIDHAFTHGELWAEDIDTLRKHIEEVSKA